MKKIFKSIGLFAIGSLLFTSCSDDDHTGLSELDYTRPTVTISSSENNVTVNENAIEDSYSITLTASIPQAVTVNLYIPFVQTGGNATAGDDYEVGTITIAAGSTSGTTSVEVYSTGDIEGDESFTLSPGDVINANVSSFSLNVTIADDYINDVIEFTMDWSGTSTIELTDDSYVSLEYCDIDFDLALWGDSGFLGYVAATAGCPESGGFYGLPDGNYYLVVELYDNPFATMGVSDPVDLRFSYSQEFFGSGEFTFEGFTLADAPGEALVAIITIEDGYNYTVTPQ